MAEERPPQRSNPSSNAGWTALGTLLGGVIAWGGIGALLDWWLAIPNRIGLLVGMVVGLATAVYMVIKRFG